MTINQSTSTVDDINDDSKFASIRAIINNGNTADFDESFSLNLLTEKERGL